MSSVSVSSGKLVQERRNVGRRLPSAASFDIVEADLRTRDIAPQGQFCGCGSVRQAKASRIDTCIIRLA